MLSLSRRETLLSSILVILILANIYIWLPIHGSSGDSNINFVDQEQRFNLTSIEYINGDSLSNSTERGILPIKSNKKGGVNVSMVVRYESTDQKTVFLSEKNSEKVHYPTNSIEDEEQEDDENKDMENFRSIFLNVPLSNAENETIFDVCSQDDYQKISKASEIESQDFNCQEIRLEPLNLSLDVSDDRIILEPSKRSILELENPTDFSYSLSVNYGGKEDYQIRSENSAYVCEFFCNPIIGDIKSLIFPDEVIEKKLELSRGTKISDMKVGESDYLGSESIDINVVGAGGIINKTIKVEASDQ